MLTYITLQFVGAVETTFSYIIHCYTCKHATQWRRTYCDNSGLLKQYIAQKLLKEFQVRLATIKFFGVF